MGYEEGGTGEGLEQIALSELIEHVRLELNVAAEQAKKANGVRFKVDEATLQVQVAITRGNAGKLGLAVIGVGYEQNKTTAAIHTVSLKLKVETVVETEDGKAVNDTYVKRSVGGR